MRECIRIRENGRIKFFSYDAQKIGINLYQISYTYYGIYENRYNDMNSEDIAYYIEKHGYQGIVILKSNDNDFKIKIEKEDAYNGVFVNVSAKILSTWSANGSTWIKFQEEC